MMALAGALGRRVPPLGVQAESEGAPHLARWAAYNVLEALCALPDAEAVAAVLTLYTGYDYFRVGFRHVVELDGQ